MRGRRLTLIATWLCWQSIICSYIACSLYMHQTYLPAYLNYHEFDHDLCMKLDHVMSDEKELEGRLDRGHVRPP